MKSSRERTDIISACREVATYRGAVQVTGTTQRTVKRVIARHEAGGTAPERARRGYNHHGVAELVAARLKATAGRISAKRLLPAVRAAWNAGPARNFRRPVAEAGRAEHHRGRRPAVWSPGEYLVIDWGTEGGVVANVVVDHWGRFLPVHTTAVSLLDRLVHHANVVITEGDCYRMCQARTRGGTTLTSE